MWVKTSIALTVFEDAKAIAKGARTLVTHANFQMHPKFKLYPSSFGGGAIKTIIKIEQNYTCAHN